MNLFEFNPQGKLTKEGKRAARAVKQLLKPGRRISEVRMANAVTKATGVDFRPSNHMAAFAAGTAIDALVQRVVRGATSILSDKAPHITYTVKRSKR